MSEADDPNSDLSVGRRTLEFRRDLEALLNRHSRENGSNTPDFILARYLLRQLDTFDESVRERERWYGIACSPGSIAVAPRPAPFIGESAFEGMPPPPQPDPEPARHLASVPPAATHPPVTYTGAPAWLSPPTAAGRTVLVTPSATDASARGADSARAAADAPALASANASPRASGAATAPIGGATEAQPADRNNDTRQVADEQRHDAGCRCPECERPHDDGACDGCAACKPYDDGLVPV